jgi:hypothetical protein
VGRTQTDGPTIVEDLDKTEANKALAVSLIEDVLMVKIQARLENTSVPKSITSTTLKLKTD